ncbi:hypothetical protein OXYTRIMIC_483 [Oxytricha trifallax]|uniref:Uncharacterized protein n=1 Tax=Oxytricha trifallax TaxID=1172189 RepID=A0A073HZT8_9SPIT|nr:hypothetical protein OXYTRIMIC_483 [Oxytricha trifallax]
MFAVKLFKRDSRVLVKVKKSKMNKIKTQQLLNNKFKPLQIYHQPILPNSNKLISKIKIKPKIKVRIHLTKLINNLGYSKIKLSVIQILNWMYNQIINSQQAEIQIWFPTCILQTLKSYFKTSSNIHKSMQEVNFMINKPSQKQLLNPSIHYRIFNHFYSNNLINFLNFFTH